MAFAGLLQVFGEKGERPGRDDTPTRRSLMNGPLRTSDANGRSPSCQGGSTIARVFAAPRRGASAAAGARAGGTRRSHGVTGAATPQQPEELAR